MTEQPGNSIELSHAAVMPAPQGGALPTGLEWQALERMAHTLADSSLVPYKLRGKPGDVAVILLAAREYGIPPLMALSKLPVINGQPAPMGELMQALILRAGHRMTATFRNPDGSTYDGRKITPEHYGEAVYRRSDWQAEESLRFTIAEAITAGLVRILDNGSLAAYDDKNRPLPWMLYTPNMARWRAVANAARLNFADVLLGLSYLPEELGAIVDENGAPIEGEPVAPRGAPPSGTIEQRTAQESADKLSEQPWPDHVLAAVTVKAEADGYIDATVRYDGDTMTLREAIERHVADRKHTDTVDAELVDEPSTTEPRESAQPVEEGDPGAPVEVEDVPEEAASAPQEAAQPVPDAQPAPAGETPQEAALDVAREVLMCNDAGVLLTYYNGAASEGLLELDVLPVVDDGDLSTLEAPDNLGALSLGALIINAGKYVKAHGIAVRDPEPEAAFSGPAPSPEGEDPWAGGSATAGGPTREQLGAD